MLRRYWRTWVVFGLAVVMLAAVVGNFTRMVIITAEQEQAARRDAAQEESIRLVLWRMDAALLPLVTTEGARPVADFTGDNQLLVTSPPALTLLHFQYRSDGQLWSPQEVRGAPFDSRLAQLRDKLSYTAVVEGLGGASMVLAEGNFAGKDVAAQQQNAAEFELRRQSVDNAAVANVPLARQAPSVPELVEANLVPMWVAGELLLVRRVSTPEGELLQGVWLDWPTVRSTLRSAALDLMPSAKLVPATAATPLDRVLATLPIELQPGQVAVPAQAHSGAPLGVMLLGVVVATAAVLALLIGQISLSERRASFVTAVTHELRTPLTTLRAYSEMLAEGMVPDEQKRHDYLLTMQRESVRLGHLIDNVLAYSQLERGKRGLRADAINLAELFARLEPRLAARSAEAGVQLAVEVENAGLAPAVRGDATAIEQILFNLVDNACKYASAVESPRITVMAKLAAQRVQLTVTDNGPGIASCDRERIFQPFHKSAQRAAVSAPGVGLGLALCRQLAQQMRGSLALEQPASGGTRFLLCLPAVTQSGSTS